MEVATPEWEEVVTIGDSSVVQYTTAVVAPEQDICTNSEPEMVTLGTANEHLDGAIERITAALELSNNLDTELQREKRVYSIESNGHIFYCMGFKQEPTVILVPD
eukprot:sb/3477985/